MFKPETSFSSYQHKASRTRAVAPTPNVELSNYALGLVCEAGEVGDILKKVIFHGHDLDDEELKKELGDVLWYLSNICNVLGYSMEEIADLNITKLRERYPNGFNVNDSKNRKE